MNLEVLEKFIENKDKVSDKTIIETRNAMQRRLDKKIDNNEVTVLLATRVEILNEEIEKRGLSL